MMAQGEFFGIFRYQKKKKNNNNGILEFIEHKCKSFATSFEKMPWPSVVLVPMKLKKKKVKNWEGIIQEAPNFGLNQP